MKVVIVGGGTAGWITALMVQRQLGSAARITLVQSSEIGILGAGEGTTPHFIGAFLDQVGIPISALVTHAGATIKSGIHFTNWLGDGTGYHHPFEDRVTPSFELEMHPPGRAIPSERTSYYARAALSGRAPLTARPAFEVPSGADPIRSMAFHGTFALHFNAADLARFLERVGRERGIQVVDGRVIDASRDVRGNLTDLRLATGQVLPCKLVFDCTGFRRLLLGEALGARWHDVTDSLPVDRAIPFELPLEAPVRPMTEARAMDAGWAWKIPTQARYGCGYVYDSDYLDEDAARDEIRRTFGAEGPLERVFRFNAGYYETIWEKNCFAVGVSTGFLEPIEATSIWLSVITLREFLRLYLPNGDRRSREAFHTWYRTLMERTVAFLYQHYVTPREDTPFWATFQQRTVRPPLVQAILGDTGMRWAFEDPPELGGNPSPFPLSSWGRVAEGLHQFDAAQIDRLWRYYGLHEGFEQRLRSREQDLERYVRDSLSHAEVIARLGGHLPG